MAEALRELPHQRAFKFVSILLIFIATVQHPLISIAGDAGTPPQPVSDANYFYYTHTDPLGSAHILTEGKGESKHSGIIYKKGDLLQRFEYAPFGRESFVLNPNLQFDPSYTGQKYDIETGLYYYKARYYDPLLGRFIQPDTIVPDAKDPQAYNRYSYCANNPLKYIDPSGHSFGSWFKKLLGAFLGALVGLFITVATLGTGLGVAGTTLASLFANASFSEMLVAGALGGMAGGVVGGAISGGLKGAIVGGLLGFASGAILGGLGHGISSMASEGAKFAAKSILFGAGAALSYKTGGWQGLILFGASIVGAAVGGKLGLRYNGRLPTDIGAIGGPSTDRQVRKLESIIQQSLDEEIGPKGMTAPLKETFPEMGDVWDGLETQTNVSPSHGSSLGGAAMRGFGVAASVETTELGLELAVAGVPMLPRGPLGFIAGSFLIVTGLGMAGFGALGFSEMAGITNNFIEP